MNGKLFQRGMNVRTAKKRAGGSYELDFFFRFCKSLLGTSIMKYALDLLCGKFA